MNQTVRFQEILRRLAIIDEGFVEDQSGLRLGLPGFRLDPKTAALARVAALAAIGAPGVCLDAGAPLTSSERCGVAWRRTSMRIGTVSLASRPSRHGAPAGLSGDSWARRLS